MNKFYQIKSPTEILFNNELQLLPSVTELFEYELAYLERTAYGKSLGNELRKIGNLFQGYG